MKQFSWIFLALHLVACSTTSGVLKESEGIILVPQWHLSPQTNTKTSTAQVPQATNQNAIFNELSTWIKNNYVQAIVVEGCETDLTSNPDQKFNGWSLNDLKKESHVENIQTHVALKIIAKFGNKAHIECGDNLKLIKENQIALSDVRGLSGFKFRIEQKDLPEKDKKRFIEGVREVLHLSKNAPDNEILKSLNAELKDKINSFEMLVQKRNDVFLEKASHIKGRKVIVIGAIHINDLKSKLTEANIPFAVWTPNGLNKDDVDLLESLKSLMTEK